MKPLKRERGRGGPTASPSAQKLAAKATTPPKAAKTKKEGTKKKSSVTSPATPRSARAPSGDWTCDNCGHAHRTTRRSAETLAACVRCTCLRGDVLHEFRPQRPSFALSPDPLRRLLVDRPMQTTYPLVVAGDRVDPVRRWLTINPHSFPGSKLYARFHKAFLKSKDKSVKLMLHGTSGRAALRIAREGLDPSLRVSGGDWFTEDPNYAISRAIAREEYDCYGAIESASNGGPIETITELAVEARDENGNSVFGGFVEEEYAIKGRNVTETRVFRRFDRTTIREASRKSVRLVVAAVLLDDSTRIGDHVVSKNHHHSLPLYVIDFERLESAA